VILKHVIEPRFSEADPLGHINNTALPVWFEHARNPFFQIFNPDLDVSKWNIILKKYDVEFVGQIYIGKNVEIRSRIEKIGNSSFTVIQEAWQSEKLVAKGNTVLVYFDYVNQKSEAIPESTREQLRQYLCE
jgi:acyl-CoA thioester hydrolase